MNNSSLKLLLQAITRLNNIKEPIEIGRIVRSFDPCVSCATHLIGSSGDTEIVEVLV